MSGNSTRSSRSASGPRRSTNGPVPQGRLIPMSWTVLREGLGPAQVARDVAAGVIVGIVALPLAIAFGIASGVKPEQGLYTAIVAGFLISVFGGSRVQIGGPTGAFIVLVYGVVTQFGYEGLALATMMAGALLVLMGVARLGNAIKFVPYPVTVGFTAGIALIIAASQLRDFFGLDTGELPADFVGKLALCVERLETLTPSSLALGLLTMLVMGFWPRVSPRIPGPLIAVLATTVLARVFELPAETIGDRFGGVPTSLPHPSLPAFDLQRLRELFPSALAIAILAAIESLLSAVVADGMISGRHRSNMELVAQGIANLASPILGGIPATGAIARTATNVKNGGRTPLAGLVHSLTLVAIMVFLADWARYIPLATLAGVLLIVAYNMSEWRVFVRLFKSPRSDVVVLLVTFALTVIVDITVALGVGMVLASFLFMKRMAEVTQVASLTGDLPEEHGGERGFGGHTLPPHVDAFEVQGSFFFGAASKFQDAMNRVEGRQKVLILHVAAVLSIDATGLRALEDLKAKLEHNGTALILSGAHTQTLYALARSGLLERIGEENVVADVGAAVARAQELLAAKSAAGAAAHSRV
jgi:SulP family sulfate permease